jgi:CRP-like cAMP-binding protein
VEALSTIEIFQDLTQREMEEIDQAATLSTCEAGRVFYGPEETGEVLFLLKRGRVQLYRLSPEGKKLVVEILEPGSVFGEMSLIGQGMHNTFAEAVEDCTLCVMSRSDVEYMLTEKPRVAIRFMEAMASRLKGLETKLEDIAFKSIPARLATLLLQLSKQEDVIQGYTHQDLAEMIGTYRETATQTLNQFKGMGLIEIERKKIQVVDRELLEQQVAV